MTHHIAARLARPWLAAALLLACAVAGAQQIDDVPPAVQNNVPPNFMFMVDNSGSMNNIVPAAPYSPTATYQNACTGSNITVVPTTSSVELRVQNGVPKVRFGSSTLIHVSLRASTSTSAACFNNTATYHARLLANGGTSTDRVPDNSYLDSDYSGHFLNWYFGTFSSPTPVTGWTDRKVVTTAAVETRMEIARRAAKDAVDSLPIPASGRTAVRIGLSTYRSGGDGGQLRVAMQNLTTSSRTSIKSAIDALSPSGLTPLATTFSDIARYMSTGYNGNVATARDSAVNIDTLLRISGTDNTARNSCLANSPVSCSAASPTAAQKPIQEWCQRTSLFAVTDGRPTHDRGFNNNTYVRDYDGDCSGANASTCRSNGAAGAWDQKTNRTYEGVGTSIEGSDYMDDVAKLLFDVDWRPDLQPARGTKTSKNNISTYMIGFADPAVQNDPLLINTARQGGGKFIAASDGPTLTEAFRDVITDALAKDAAAAAVAVTNAQITSGSVGYASSYNSGSWYGDLEAYSLDPSTGLQNGAVVWSARDKLNAQTPGSRKIASYNGSAGVAFSTANGAAFRATTASLSDALIDYTRGVRTGEGTTFRARTHLLGDIINAEPVVVNYTSSDPVVFQAANDGMLHVIDGRVAASATTRGQELWAYVPQLVHGKLAGRADPIFQHEYLVDGTPAAAEVTGVGSVTRMLVGGLGKGGAGYYALNITSGTAANEAAAANKVMWESRRANMGYSFGTPLVVKTAAGWRVVVASGYRNDGGTGGLGGDGRGHVWVLNPADGTVDREFLTPSGFGTSSAGLGVAYLASPSNVSATAAVRYVYGGDLLGNVWRFDLDAAGGTAPVRIALLTDASGNPQPITAPPVVTPVAGSATKFFVYLGTGQYFSIDDVPGTGTANATAGQTQTIYGIVDDTSVAAPSLPSIRNSTASCPANGGNGGFACQTATQNPDGSYTVSHNTVDLTRKSGFYLDIPITGGRVNTQVAVTRGGTLVVVVNQPSNVVCNPGGSSYLFQLSAATGGAIPTTLGGSQYYDSVFFVADALSSRPLIVTTAGRPRGLLRLSDKTTQSRAIDESTITVFRRIYMRPLN